MVTMIREAIFTPPLAIMQSCNDNAVASMCCYSLKKEAALFSSTLTEKFQVYKHTFRVKCITDS
jgi:hypothetical protein